MDSEDQKTLEELESLLKSPGWARLLNIMAEVTSPVIDRIMQPAATQEAWLQAEHSKGIVEGVELMLNTPQRVIETVGYKPKEVKDWNEDLTDE